MGDRGKRQIDNKVCLKTMAQPAALNLQSDLTESTPCGTAEIYVSTSPACA